MIRLLLQVNEILQVFSSNQRDRKGDSVSVCDDVLPQKASNMSEFHERFDEDLLNIIS